MSENKTYNVTELIKCKFIGLKSRESIMKYIESGKLHAKNIITTKSRYTRYIISSEDIEDFYKNLKK